MKEITTQNYALLHSLQEEEEMREVEEDEPPRLSFGDLPPSHSPTTPSARPDLLFEFSGAAPAPAAPHSYYNDIVFCGKIIHDDEDEEAADQDEEQLNEYQKRDYFATVRSQSLRKPSSPDYDSDHRRRLSASIHHSAELVRPKCSAGDLDYHAQRVNISALTSMSAKSKRRMFMFGPVKFKPEMELSAIKQRQAKLPATEKTSPSGKGQWGMLKSSFRGRSHFTSMLARSLGCIPVAGGGGVEPRLGAAN